MEQKVMFNCLEVQVNFYCKQMLYVHVVHQNILLTWNKHV